MQVAQRPRVAGRYRPAFGLRCRCAKARHRQEEDPHTNIPLVGVKAAATITDAACEVTLVQRYRNDEDVPLEVGYTFPLDSRAAVCRFEVEIDGKRVVGSVLPNAEARDTYDDAIAEGSGAYLLEQKSEEIFQMNVGNLPPSKECTIFITYVAELPLEGEMVRFTLPTTIAPRYYGRDTTASEDDALKEVTTTISSSSKPGPYGLELDIAIEMPSPVLSVESPSHPIKFQLMDDAPTKGRVTLSTKETALDRDFVLMIQQKDAHQPGLWVDSERQAVMLSLYPKFVEVEQNREFIFLLDRSGSMAGASIDNAKNALQLFLRSLPEGCKFNIVSFGSQSEFLFQRSRIYDDHSLQEASSAVERMMADMGGTEVLEPIQEILRDHSSPDYARQVFVLTDGEVSNIDAVLRVIRARAGSSMPSEIVSAVERGVCTYSGARHYIEQFWYHCNTCYRRDPLYGCCVVCKEVCHKDHNLEPRFGAFFCDCGSDRGHLCRARTPDESREPISMPPVVPFRVFTLGIGAAASRQLVLGMAEAGHGTAEFVVPGERIESKVMRQLRLAMQPSVEDVTCDWGGSWGPVLTQAPETPPPLFDGTRLCIFGLVKPDVTLPQDATEPVKVSYTSPGSATKEREVHEFLPSAALVASTSAVRTLAAKNRIKELSRKEADAFRTEKDQFKAEIEALGVKFQLATAHTSFVAKDEREEATQGTMRRRVVPSYRVAAYPFHGGVSRGGRGGGRGGRGGGGARGGRGGGQFMAQHSGYGGKGYRFDAENDIERDRSRSRSPPRASGLLEEESFISTANASLDLSNFSRQLPLSSNSAFVAKRKRKCRRGGRNDIDEDEESEMQLERAPLAAERNGHDHLASLVILQRANGSFELDDKLAQLVGLSLAELRSALQNLAPASDKGDASKRQQVWATALALAYLETKLSAIADDWAMMAGKAHRWLHRETQADLSLAKVAWLNEAKKAIP